jgi:hypothetical protein
MKNQHDGYNPNHAGNQVLKSCNFARENLLQRLGKRPPITDEVAYENWIIAVANIRSMDYNELMKAMEQTQ